MNQTLKALEALRERICMIKGVRYNRVIDNACNELKSSHETITEVKKKIRIYDQDNNTLDEPWDYGEM